MVTFTSPYPRVAIPELPLHALLLEHPGRPREPHKPALIDAFSGEAVTYVELPGRIERLAAGLYQHLGLPERAVIAVFAPNELEYGLLAIAAVRLGCALTPANPTYTHEELRFQLEDSAAALLVTVPALVPTARQAVAALGRPVRLLVFGPVGVEGARPLRELEIPGGKAPVRDVRDVKDRLAFLCYSSGTTGRPKGVELTHYNIVSVLAQVYLSSDPALRARDETTLAVLPLYHVLALVLVLLNGIYMSYTVVVQPKFELERFLATIQRFRVTVCSAVPPIAVALVNNEALVRKYDLSSLRLLSCGAAPMGREVQDSVAKTMRCTVRQGYGMTELSPVSHRAPADPSKIVSGSVGVLLPNCEAKIVDPTTGKELTYEEEGELWVRGPNVMKGYLNRPDATTETIDREGWLHTGDVARVDRGGNFFITDRLKELIKVKGLQVAPAELEAVLLVHPAVADAAVIGVPDERAGEAPKAFVVLKPGPKATKETAEEIVAFLDTKLAPHKRLRGGVQFVDGIPKSPSGKILRRLLKDLEKQQQQQKQQKPASKL